MDFIKKIRKNTKTNTSDVVEKDDVDLVMRDNIDDWKEMMNVRSLDGYDHIYIWEFDERERVYILESESGKTSYDIDRPREHSSTVVRSYSAGHFCNSSEFKDWLIDLFPGCTLTLEYRGKRGYFVRLTW